MRHRRGVSGVREILLHADALLHEDVADLAEVVEKRLLDDLARQRRRPLGVLGERRARHGQFRGKRAAVVFALVHLGVEGEVAELRLRERVDLRRGVLARRELAEHHGEKLRVGQLLEGKALQAVVAIRIHDAARRHIVPDHGNLSRFVEAESGLRGRLLDVACAHAGKGRERFGRVGLLLCTAKGGDVGFDRGDTLVVELALHLGQAGSRGIVVIEGLVNRHDLRVGRMVVFQEHLANQLLEVTLVELLAQAFERILVA